MSRIMKIQYRTVAIFTLVLLLIISSVSCRARASRPLHSKMDAPAAPVSRIDSSSQVLEGLQGKEQNPFKKVDSSFRRIPPSRSNPTQNKYKPPWKNCDQNTKQRRRLSSRPGLLSDRNTA